MSFLSSRNGITLFTLLTAGIHLILGIRDLDTPLGVVFVLNAIGYAALLYLTFWTPVFLKPQAPLIRWAFIAFAAVTVILYFVMNIGHYDELGYVTKLIEVLLLVGLWQSR